MGSAFLSLITSISSKARHVRLENVVGQPVWSGDSFTEAQPNMASTRAILPSIVILFLNLAIARILLRGWEKNVTPVFWDVTKRPAN